MKAKWLREEEEGEEEEDFKVKAIERAVFHWDELLSTHHLRCTDFY